MKKALIALALASSLALAACGGGGDGGATGDTQQPAAPATEAPPVAADDEEPDEGEEPAAPSGDTGDVVFGVLPSSLPRTETMYFGGQQWGTPVSNNPFTLNANNSLVIETSQGGSRLWVYETLFMHNFLDGELYPLIATGDPQWNGDMSVLTVEINENAHFSDGTPITANDVAATFEMHNRIGTGLGSEYSAFISQVVAPDEYTAELHLNMDNFNPMRALEWLARVYIISADFMDAKMEEHGGDNENFRNDPWYDLVYSGPYRPVYMSSQMVVFERDNNYWGQHSSMWGKLAEPRYLVHNIYGNNDSMRAAFAAGEIDVNQQFMTRVSDMWEVDGLPISTFLDEPPFYLPGTMPSIWFNTTLPGLDQKEIRKAIAYAIDYDQIISAAMSGYSPTFDEAPRSIAVPLEGEQRFVDNAALAHLQWDNRDLDRANSLLDEYGIIDTDGDGIREWEGENLSFTLMCPMGWSDWEAALEIVAAAGQGIGIDLTTTFVESTVWTEAQQTGNFDIIMLSTASVGVSAPWSRAFNALYTEDPNADRVYWAFHRMYDPEINELIMRAGSETDESVLREHYTEISRFMLEEMPLVYLMYRPWWFHTVNESVWTGFPEEGDGTNVPPSVLIQTYGVAGLYNVHLAN